MKRVFVSAVLTAVLFMISLVSCLAVCKIAESTEKDIAAVSEAYKNGDIKAASALADTAYGNWQKNEKYFTLMLHDGQFSEIGSSVIRIKYLTECESAEAPAEINSLMEKLRHIRADEFPSWYNIL